MKADCAIEPERQKLEAILSFAGKRVGRAIVKRDAATVEVDAAARALDAAADALAEWIVANPDREPSFIETITAKGEDH